MNSQFGKISKGTKLYSVKSTISLLPKLWVTDISIAHQLKNKSGNKDSSIVSATLEKDIIFINKVVTIETLNNPLAIQKKSVFLVQVNDTITAFGFSDISLLIIDVNIDNIKRVETHIQMGRFQNIGGINKFGHLRLPAPLDQQTTISMNRDTLYSIAVLDLEKPVTVTFPETNGRYLTIEVLDEDHYVYNVYTKPGKYTFSKKDVGTRYAVVLVRVFMNQYDPNDITIANTIQDRLKIEGGLNEPFVLPNYNMEQYKTIFKLLHQLVHFTTNSTIGGQGRRGEVDRMKHTIITIAGWGALPPKNAMYEIMRVDLDIFKKYKIEVPADVPVGAFWSISMYDSSGFIQKNDLGVYSFNNTTAKRNSDDSYTIHIGGCNDGRSNCLPFAGEGFYYVWRMYEPGEEILNGEYIFNLPEEIE